MLTQISNRTTKVLTEPYPHVVLDNFFDSTTVAGIEAHFGAVKSLGLSDTFRADRLARFPSYDAYCYVFPRSVPAPLDIFLSRGWKDYLSGLFKLDVSDDIIAEYHHHKPESKGGVMHTDFIECFFTENQTPDKMNPWYFECDYTGSNPPGVRIKSRVRAIAFLYYFGSPDWMAGDGGETEIPGSMVEPIHNRLFAFEISPASLHRFVANKRLQRNTVIGWLHMTKEKAETHFGFSCEHWNPTDVNGQKGDTLNAS